MAGIISAAADNSFRKPLLQYLKIKRQQGLIRKININAATTSMSDLVYGCMMRFFLFEGLQVSGKEIKKAAEEIVDLVMHGLKP